MHLREERRRLVREQIAWHLEPPERRRRARATRARERREVGDAIGAEVEDAERVQPADERRRERGEAGRRQPVGREMEHGEGGRA